VSDEWQAEWQAERQEMARMTPVGGERKPLEGYDWRGRLFALAEMAGNTGMSAGDSFPLKDELAAHIESLEADVDALVEAAVAYRATVATVKPGLWTQQDALDAAIARVKGRAK
jgi:hypothetical protein